MFPSPYGSQAVSTQQAEENRTLCEEKRWGGGSKRKVLDLPQQLLNQIQLEWEVTAL